MGTDSQHNDSPRLQRQVRLLLAASVVMVACDGTRDPLISTDSVTPTVFPLPAQVRGVRAISNESLQLQVEVNSVPVEVDQTGNDNWTAIVNVPANRTSSVSVEWTMDYVTADATYDMTLAQQQRVITVGAEPVEVYFNLGGYNTNNHDFDDDGFSNLDEIIAGRSPVSLVDGYIDNSGIYSTGTVVPPSLACGSQFPIATQIQFTGNEPAGLLSDDLSAWWCARLVVEESDALNNVLSPAGIEILVTVEDDVAGLTDSAPNRRYDDDSVEIFIDGNNSKGITYDGWDDYQFIFLADGNNAAPMTKGRRLPPGLSSSVSVTATGYQLLVFIPHSEVGIQNGQPFGINVEVNDDDDGGERDNKVAWVGEEGVDLSWVQPRKFGTSQIP